MDDELGGLFQEQWPPKKLDYYDMTGEPRPVRGDLMDNLRIGFGHLSRLPADVVVGSKLNDVFPETVGAIDNFSQDIGESIAGRRLYGVNEPDQFNDLLASIRDLIRGKDMQETFGGQRATKNTP